MLYQTFSFSKRDLALPFLMVVGLFLLDFDEMDSLSMDRYNTRVRRACAVTDTPTCTIVQTT